MGAIALTLFALYSLFSGIVDYKPNVPGAYPFNPQMTRNGVRLPKGVPQEVVNKWSPLYKHYKEYALRLQSKKAVASHANKKTE